MSNLSLRLKEIRNQLAGRPSQNDVAKKLNIAQSTYARFESGTREPPISFVIAFCKEFNVSADYLLGLKPVNTNSSDVTEYSQFLSEAKEALRVITKGDAYSDLTQEQRTTIETTLQAFREYNATKAKEA